jgi:hypothetical protein
MIKTHKNIFDCDLVQGLADGLIQVLLRPCANLAKLALEFRPQLLDRFELNLDIDPDTDLVAAWGLNKKEYEGLDLIWFRLAQLLSRVGL